MKLRDAEGERLNTLIQMGKHPARQVLKARILLPADASESGEGWSDSRIAAAVDTSIDTISRTRQQLVEEGAEAVLSCKHSPALARPRIFDEAAEARRLVERFEWHDTLQHGSWPDMAEFELGVLSSQCLDRRIPDKQTLIDEVTAWQDRRNENHTRVDGQFTTADARVKLKRLYPAI